MSELDASLFHLQQNTQSVAFKFFSESVKEIERQIHSTAGLNFFTSEQIDFIVLICDQFQKLVQLRSKSKLIDNLLTYNFPEFFQLAKKEDFPATTEPAYNETVELTDKKIENQFSFVCDTCDEDVPILNNDLNYSTRLHLSSPYHLEVVSVLRKIQESAASSVANSSLKVSVPLKRSPVVGSLPKTVSRIKFTSPAVVSNSKITTPLKLSPEPSIISAEEQSFQRFSWIQSQRQNKYLLWRRSQYYCCLCDAYLPTQHNFDAHVRGFQHQSNVAADRNTAAANVGNSKIGNTSSSNKQSGTSRIETPTKSTSSVNLSSKSQVATPERSTSGCQDSQVIVIDNGVRICTLCDVRMPSEANFVSHTNGVSHRTKFKTFLKTFDDLTKTLNNVTISSTSPSIASATNVKSNAVKNGSSNASTDFLVTRDGTLYCSLCNVKVPGKAQQDSHFNGSAHKEQVKIFSKKPDTKCFTDFIISKDGKRYCMLCNVNLAGESQLTGHKYGKLHKQKIKEYEEKYFS